MDIDVSSDPYDTSNLRYFDISNLRYFDISKLLIRSPKLAGTRVYRRHEKKKKINVLRSFRKFARCKAAG